MAKKDAMNYDYFKVEGFVLHGKFADYVDQMWKQNAIMESIFRRLVDIYAIAAIVGLNVRRRLPDDFTTESKRTIQLEQIAPEYRRFSTIMQVIQILDESRGMSEEERVREAMDNSPKNKETYERNMELFNSYARGGIEYMYEELVLRAPNIDELFANQRIANIHAFIHNPIIPDI